MAGGEHLDVASVARADGGDEGREAACGEVFAKEAIDVLEGEGYIAVSVEAGAGVGAADGGEERGAEAVAGDVGEGDDEAAVAEELPVEVVAAGGVGGEVPSADLEAGEGGADAGQERLLDGAGDLEIVGNLFELTLDLGFAKGGLDVLANLFADESCDEAAGENNGGVEGDGGLLDGVLAEVPEAGAPAEVVGAAEKTDGCDDACDARDTRIEAKNGEHDEGKKSEDPGGGDGAVLIGKPRAGEGGDAEGDDGDLEDDAEEEKGLGEVVAVVECFFNSGEHPELVADDGEQRENAEGAHVSAEGEDADGDGCGEDEEEGTDAVDAAPLTLEKGLAEGQGIELHLGHEASGVFGLGACGGT